MKTLAWKGLISLLVLFVVFAVLGGPAARAPLPVPMPAGPVLATASPVVFVSETPKNGSLHGLLNPVTVIVVVYSDSTPGATIARVGFHLDGMNLTSAGVFNNSAFTLPVGFAFRDGPHAANFTVMDNFGTLAYHNWTFTVDSLPPALIVTSPAVPMVPVAAIPVEGTTFPAIPQAAPVSVTVTALPAHLSLSAFANATTGAFRVLVPLTQGPNVLFVNATDAAGNMASVIKSIVSDTVKPQLAVLTPQNRSVVATSIVRVAGMGEFGAYLTVNGFSVAVAPDGTWSVDLALPDGLNVLQVVEADQVGNANYAILVVFVDSDMPRLSLTSPLPAVTNRSSIDLSGYVNDTKAVALVVRYNQNVRQVPFNATTGRFATTLASLPDGRYSIEITAVDAAQHTTVLTAAVVVDTTAPAVTLQQPPDGLETNQSTVVLTGTVDDPNAAVLVNDQEIRPDASGHWQAVVALRQGGNLIEITAVDAVGNRAAPVLLRVTYTSPYPDLGNQVAANQRSLDEISAIMRLSLVGILLLSLTLALVLYTRASRRARENRRILVAIARTLKKKP